MGSQPAYANTTPGNSTSTKTLVKPGIRQFAGMTVVDGAHIQLDQQTRSLNATGNPAVLYRATSHHYQHPPKPKPHCIRHQLLDQSPANEGVDLI